MADSDLKLGAAFAAAAMSAPSARMRVIAENIANASSTAPTPGEEAYQHRVVVFDPLAAKDGDDTVPFVPRVQRLHHGFRVEYEPNHPAADVDGFVKYPNVNTSLEVAQMGGAIGAYKANLKVWETLRTVEQKTIDLLK